MPRYHWQADDAVTQADIYQNLEFQYALLKPRDGLSRDEQHAPKHNLALRKRA